MKRLSVKLKLTLWITLLMLLFVTLVLGFLVAISSSVVTENTYDQLNNVLRSNVLYISRDQGKLVFDDGFSFTQNGVYTLVYSESGALLAGQPPLAFPEEVEFESGVIQPVESENGTYYVLDYWLPFGWDDGVWVRGMIQAPDVADVVDDMIGLTILLLPLLVIFGALGAYLLARSTFRPIDRIIRAAGAIEEGSDLSERIGLPPGQDEISRLGQAFDNMFARLETSFESEKQFTSDASHELRTPVAVILAQCDEAQRHAQTPEQYAQAIEVIDRQAKKMSALIQQLLQMTRLEQGTQRASFEEADLSALVEIICAEQPAFPQGITLQTSIQPDVTAWFDVTLMSRLLQNLISNAARYGRPQGHIWVSLTHTDDTIELAVRDDGIGIPEAKLDKIWQRFYQVDPARAGNRGTGLGLTMVRQIAQLHGGEVTVQSAEGVGSCFTLRFPDTPQEPQKKEKDF
ncbi:MAG: HAMP domain-containing sensor histidine kinase [Butyricicoccus sp.]|nr:HAMP domain-containing sensor histidine kinase [Butyricicoccus sp.]